MKTLFLLSAVSLFAGTYTVSTTNQLVSAVSNSTAGDTILMQDGTYSIGGGGTIVVRTDNLTIASQSGVRENVIVSGPGMGVDMNGFWISADNVTIRDITVEKVGYHCIQTDVRTDGLKVLNCVLRDAGEQILKVPRDTAADPSDNGLVEGCLFYYTAGVGYRDYMGGIDCHNAKNWVVRNNTFKFIRSPGPGVSEHAIHFWNESESTLVERNLIIDCDRGIGFGLGASPHKAGIIRNNMIYHSNISGTDFDDVGIGIENSPNTKIYNNTIFFENDYYAAVEYRFTATLDVSIVNNLTNRQIVARDGAAAAQTANVTTAQASWFRNLSEGDLHLATAGPPSVINQGIALPGLTDDFDGDARPFGTGVDVGADEYRANAIQPFYAPFPAGLSGETTPFIYDIRGRLLEYARLNALPSGRYIIVYNAAGPTRTARILNIVR